MEERKKFKDTKFGKWVAKAGKAAPDVIESVGMAVGGPWGTVVAKVGTALGRVIDKDPDNQQAADLLEEFSQMEELFRIEYEYHTIEVQEITKRWEVDSKTDSWLAKNVRPLTLVYLLLVFSGLAVMDSIDPVDFEVKDVYIKLLDGALITVIIAYFGSRGFEKSRDIFKK
jgi:hypothetical protein